MKRLVILFFVLVLSIGTDAQTKLNQSQQEQFVERISKAAGKMKSMECRFTQTKSMKMLSKKMQSAGKMYFKYPNKLRWQYTVPYDYTFILNADKIKIKSLK